MMKITVEFTEAPSVSEWQSVITLRGWKITNYSEFELQAKKDKGISQFPVRLSTGWNILIVDNPDYLLFTVNVPAFTDSLYAKQRILETVEEVTEAIDGVCQTNQDFDIDLLGHMQGSYRTQ